ncbi:hypothetical protein XENOCAPTIV_023172, partial [Xenoophorus captivus]
MAVCNWSSDHKLNLLKIICTLSPFSWVNPDVSSSVNRGIPPPVSVIKAWQKELVVLTSFSLNAVLFVAVLGFICVSVKRKGCCCFSVKDSAEYSLDQQEMQNPQ